MVATPREPASPSSAPPVGSGGGGADYERYCRKSPRREQAKRAALKAQRLRDAQRPSQRLVRARTPPHLGRASSELRNMIRTGGVPGYPGHPDTKPEMDPRQRARMQKIVCTMTSFSHLAKEEAEADLAEAAAEQEWADVVEAKEELRHAEETGDQRTVEAARARLDEERAEAEAAQRLARAERKEADAAAIAVAVENARVAQDKMRREKAKPPGAPIPGRPGRPARWMKGEDLAAYYAEERSETQIATLMQIGNNDPSLTYLDWSKMDLHDGIAQRLGNALRGNTHLRWLDLRFNKGFTDLACSCGKPDTASTSSLQRALAHSSVRIVESCELSHVGHLCVDCCPTGIAVRPGRDRCERHEGHRSPRDLPCERSPCGET